MSKHLIRSLSLSLSLSLCMLHAVCLLSAQYNAFNHTAHITHWHIRYALRHLLDDIFLSHLLLLHLDVPVTVYVAYSQITWLATDRIRCFDTTHDIIIAHSIVTLLYFTHNVLQHRLLSYAKPLDSAHITAVSLKKAY